MVILAYVAFRFATAQSKGAVERGARGATRRRPISPSAAIVRTSAASRHLQVIVVSWRRCTSWIPWSNTSSR